MSRFDTIIGLNEQQSKAFHQLVIESVHVNEVAAHAGVSIRTVYRWQLLPEWKNAAMVAEAAQLENNRRQLAALAENSIKTLKAVMEDDSAPAASRVSAAIGVLDRTGLGPRSAVSVEHSGSIATDAAGDLSAIDGALSALDAPDAPDPA